MFSGIMLVGLFYFSDGNLHVYNQALYPDRWACERALVSYVPVAPPKKNARLLRHTLSCVAWGQA